MNELDLSREERRFDPAVAIMASANPSIKHEPSIDPAYTDASAFIVEPSYKVFRFMRTSTVNQEENLVLRIVNQDSFTQKDLTSSNENEVHDLIFRIRSTTGISDNITIANKLLKLYNFSKEDDPAFAGIEVSSLQNFYGFLQKNVTLRCPVISLTPDSNIYASWQSDGRRIFSVLFLPDNDVRYVVFKPNDRHPGRMIRNSGITTSDNLMEEVACYRLYDWISG